MKTRLLCIFILSISISFSQHKDSTYYFYFKIGQSDQHIDSIVAFEKHFAPFRSCKTCGIKLEGYTDKIGDDYSNQVLAMKRINYVKTLIRDTVNIKVVEEVIGEKLSQNAKNNQSYRMVKMTIHSPVIIKTPILRIETEAKFEKFAELNKPVRLKVNFLAGKFHLLPDSMEDLDLLKEFLKANPQVTAKIAGHVCCSDERLLSKNRALSVYNYLVDRGINKNRLSYVGLSNSRPLVKEINEETEAINRRVEVILNLSGQEIPTITTPASSISSQSVGSNP
jgi:outer membrane protein OmpA-like peptidoglycan-associated protein